MGVVEGVGLNEFPRQGPYNGRRVKVAFEYNFDSHIMGTLVRDDRAKPFMTIIALDDGRYVMGTECQYSLD